MEGNDKKSALDALLKRRELLNALFQRRRSGPSNRSLQKETSNIVEKKETSQSSVSLDNSDIIEDSDSEPPFKQTNIHTVIQDSSDENINTSMVSLPLSHAYFGCITPQNTSPIDSNKKITILSDEIIKKGVHTHMPDLSTKQNTVSPDSKALKNTDVNIISTPYQVNIYETTDTPQQNNNCSLNEVTFPFDNRQIEDPASLTHESNNTHPDNALNPSEHVDMDMEELGPSSTQTGDFDLNPADLRESDRLISVNNNADFNMKTYCHNEDNNKEITDSEIKLTNLECETFSSNKMKADDNFVKNSVDTSKTSDLVKPGCSTDTNYMSVGMPSNKPETQAKKNLKRFLDFLSDDETGDYSAGSSDEWVKGNESESSEDETSQHARKKKRKLSHKRSCENDSIKRKKDVKVNKRKIKKTKKNEGKEYETSTGRQVKERELKPNPCLPNKCKRGCYGISEERRTGLFSFFWNLDVQRRKDWLVRSSQVVPVHRRRVDSPVPKRNITYDYYVNNGDDHQKVCQKFLLDTLDISQKYLLYTLANSNEKMAKLEERTRNIPNKYSDAAKMTVRQYFDKLPAVPSHYNRPRSSKVYLPQELKNVSNLYRLYLKECNSDNIEFVSDSLFRSIFSNEYNMSFHVPKKDKCVVCVQAEHDQNLKEKDKKKLEEHLKEKEATYKRFKMHQNLPTLKNDTVVCSFDLQKILNTPYGNSVVLYYSRKYPVFNFTLYESITQNVFCYLWGECDGKKGANEIATCLYLYLKAVDERGVKNVLFYCDSCGGQNKNKTVLSVLNYFMMHSKNVEVIQVNYLLPGHTYMPVDSVHATIEREVKKLIVWSPSQWPSYIEAARKIPEPYKVVKMDHSDFFKWDVIVEETFPTKTAKNIKIRTIRCVTLKKKNLNQIHVKYSMEEDTPTDTLKLFQKSDNDNKGKGKRSGRQKGKGKTTKGKCIDEQTVNSNTFEKVMVLSPSVLYEKQLPISDAKYKDLKRLCDNGAIPKMYHKEYLNLPHGNVDDALIMTDEEDDVDCDHEDDV